MIIVVPADHCAHTRSLCHHLSLHSLTTSLPSDLFILQWLSIYLLYPSTLHTAVIPPAILQSQIQPSVAPIDHSTNRHFPALPFHADHSTIPRLARHVLHIHCDTPKCPGSDRTAILASLQPARLSSTTHALDESALQ